VAIPLPPQIAAQAGISDSPGSFQVSFAFTMINCRPHGFNPISVLCSLEPQSTIIRPAPASASKCTHSDSFDLSQLVYHPLLTPSSLFLPFTATSAPCEPCRTLPFLITIRVSQLGALSCICDRWSGFQDPVVETIRLCRSSPQSARHEDQLHIIFRFPLPCRDNSICLLLQQHHLIGIYLMTKYSTI
jgi:hypothetical protein